MTGRSTYQYVKAVGTLGEGRGFNYPFDVALGDEGALYVLNRGRSGYGVSKRITVCTFTTEDYLGNIGGVERGDGRLDWPNSLALDRMGNFYISDEAQQRIFIFDKQGKFLSKWGVKGTGDGQFDRPAGIAFDRNENLLVVDGLNNRVQRYTKDGSFLDSWGRGGSGDGEFNNPWGITVDRTGDVYVADWRNDRIQKFDDQGNHLASWGSSGQGDGEFHRPSGVAVDRDGDVYVTDWGNERVQVLGPDGEFLGQFRGEAGRTRWSDDFFKSDPVYLEERHKADMEPEPEPWPIDIAHNASAAIEKLFWGPTSVQVDDEGRIFVTDSCRHRVQVYSKAPASTAAHTAP